MIYKDKYAFRDKEECPGERIYENCLNCHRSWHTHCGWSCETSNALFSNTAENNRYVTQSMKDSIQITSDDLPPDPNASYTSEPTTVDISDWRAWRNNNPGECDCGIYRQKCTYHKNGQTT